MEGINLIINDAFVDSIIERCILEEKCLKDIPENRGAEISNQRLKALENPMRNVLTWAEKFVKAGIDIDIFFDNKIAKENNSLYFIESSLTLAYDVQKYYPLLTDIRNQLKILYPEIFGSRDLFETHVLNCTCFLMDFGNPKLAVTLDFKNEGLNSLMQDAPWQITAEFIKRFPKFKKGFEDYIENTIIKAISQP